MKCSFLENKLGQNPRYQDNSKRNKQFAKFIKYCLNNKINIITFNYDDIIDEAIWKEAGADEKLKEPYWNPDGVYGFFCKPSKCVIEELSGQMDLATTLLILKLHGSINWRIVRGTTSPYSINEIVHHERWYHPEWYDECESVIELHLEREPLIVPPTLAKATYYEYPVLSVVWYRAYQVLLKSQKVTFIGCSLPITDVITQNLLEETIGTEDIHIVNLANSQAKKSEILKSYRRIFGGLKENNFYFEGVSNWVDTL